ncbi:MAG: hypothetical protein AB7D47_13325 [Desulfovibrio sp.]|jgi:hypothetical protein
MGAFAGVRLPSVDWLGYGLSANLTGRAPGVAGNALQRVGRWTLGGRTKAPAPALRERAWGGAHSPSYANDLYGRLLVLPARVDAGFLGSDATRDVEVWNTRDQAATLADVILDGGDGLEISALPGEVFGPRQSRRYELTLFSERGSSMLDGDVALVFTDNTLLVLMVTGQRLAVWPFVPLQPYFEALEWLTDVVTARSGLEKRTRLRGGPRLRLELDYNLRTPWERGLFEALSYTAQEQVCGVPWWPGQRLAGALPAGTQTIRWFRDPSRDPDREQEFTPGGLALVLEDAAGWEVVELAGVAAGELQLARPLERQYARGVVAPLLRCRMDAAFTRTDLPAARSTAHAAFDLLEPEVRSTEEAAQTWQGLEVYPQRLWCDVGGVSIQGGRELEDLDGETGGVHRVVHSAAAAGVVPLRLRAVTRRESATLRALLHRLAGRFTPFWLPSGRADLQLVADVVDGGTTLRIAACGCARIVASPSRRALALRTGDGELLYRGLLAARDVGGGVEELELDEALPALGREVLVSWLRRVRLDADRVELSFTRAGACIAKVRVREVTA